MKRKIAAIMLILCLGLTGITCFLLFSSDKDAPVIKFTQDIVYCEENGYGDLLKGVKATDETDGDVSDSLLVEKVYPNQEENTALVVYVAKDHSNNIVKENKVVSCKKEEKVQEKKLEDAQKNNAEISAPTIPEESTESLSSDDKLDSQQSSTEYPKITLSEEKITLDKGQDFNRISFVKNIEDDKDDKNDLYKEIQIKGDEVDTNTSGTYNMIYYVIDSDGNRSNEAVLTVVVK